MNKILLAAIGVLATQGCGGSSDPDRPLFNETFTVEPGKFMYKKLELTKAGSFTLTLTPEGGNIEAWLSPGAAAPLVVYNPNEALPMAKVFEAGKEDVKTGTNDWGPHNIVVFNRSAANVKVRCKLVVVPNPPNPPK